MITLRTFLTLLVAAFIASPAFAADAPERESIEKIVPYGISLLEAKNYKGFVEAFLKPDLLKEQTKTETIEQFAAKFGAAASADVLTVFKKLKDVKPTLDEKGTVATFTLPEAVNGEKEFKFRKVDKYWYFE